MSDNRIPKIWIMSLFPSYFNEFFEKGVIGRVFADKKAQYETLYLGDYSPKDFKGVDDSPYGGGPGMVMRADVLKACLDDIVKKGGYTDIQSDLEVIYTAPRGEVFTNLKAHEVASTTLEKDLVFICGRYEGIDERFIEKYVDRIYSLGDFVLSGGELAVMTILDASLRFLPDTLGNKFSAIEDSFEDGLIEGPLYTKPRDFEGQEVPKELLSGNHKLINEYNQKKKLEYTKRYRPDLYGKAIKTTR